MSTILGQDTGHYEPCTMHHVTMHHEPRTMTTNNIQLGRRGEEEAVSFLKKNRYCILARNYSSKFGEIDITWRAVVFAFVIVFLLSCLIVPWMVGAIKIFKWMF